MTGLHAFRVDYPTCTPIWVYSTNPDQGRQIAETLSEALHKVNGWEPRIWNATEQEADTMTTQPNPEPTAGYHLYGGRDADSSIELFPCNDDDCTREHVHVITDVGLREDLAIATRARKVVSDHAGVELTERGFAALDEAIYIVSGEYAWYGRVDGKPFVLGGSGVVP